MSERTPQPSRPEETRTVTRVGLVFESFRHFLDEYSSHVSMGGMFIGARRPLPPGSMCQLEFRLRDGHPLILGRGEVVWTRAREEGPGRPPGMGVRFHDLEGSSRDLVFAIVEHRLADGDSLFELEAEEGVDPNSSEALGRMLKEAERRRERAEAEVRSSEPSETLRLSTADLAAQMARSAESAQSAAARSPAPEPPAPSPSSPPAAAAVPEPARPEARVLEARVLEAQVPEEQVPDDLVALDLEAEDLPAEDLLAEDLLAEDQAAEDLSAEAPGPELPMPGAPAAGPLATAAAVQTSPPMQTSLPGLEDEPLLAQLAEDSADDDDDPTVVDGRWVVEAAAPEARPEPEPEPDTESEAPTGQRSAVSIDEDLVRSADVVLAGPAPRSGRDLLPASRTPEPEPSSSAGGAGAGAVNLDQLFSVAPPAEPLPIEQPPRRQRSGRRQQKRTWVALAAALVLLAVAAVLLVRLAGWWPPAEPPVVARQHPPPAPVEAPAETPAESAPSSASGPERIDIGGEPSIETEAASGTETGTEPGAEAAAPAPSAGTESASSDRPAASPPTAATAPPPPPSAPVSTTPTGRAARAVENIAYESIGGGTRLVVTLDGELSADRVTSLRLGSGTPRQLVRLRGITEAYRPPALSVGTGELLRVRTGRHVRDGVEELHIVLDLADSDVVVSRVEARGRRLEIDLAAP